MEPPLPAAPPPAPAAARLSRARLVTAVCGWGVLVIVGMLVAAGPLGALSESRAQHRLLADFRQQVNNSAAAAQSPLGAIVPTKPAEPGTAVALLQIPRLGLQRVVVEGASPTDTQSGPGHVSGTAGPGQPGNSAIVGRAAGYGAAFADLGKLRAGDDIVVTTAQGQSVYRVARPAAVNGGDFLSKSADNRLTLITSASWWPWSADPLVVTATMRDLSFSPTPQQGRSIATDGRTGDPGAYGWLIIELVLLVGAAAIAILLYRRWLPRATYLLTCPVLVALIVLSTDTFLRMLPAGV
jgi:sortase A